MPNTLNGGGFQDFLGNPIANGYLLIQLSHDAQTSTNLQLYAGTKIRVPLDSSGNVIAISIWENSLLTPANTVYYVRGFTADGEEFWSSPHILAVPTSPVPFNISNGLTLT